MRAAWDDDPLVAGWPGLPALDGDRTADACVVGLGASGLAAVAALADRGLSVVGVDAGRIAAGFLIGGAAMFLHRAIEAWGTKAAVGLYLSTLEEIDRLANYVPLRRCGSIRLAADDAELADCRMLRAEGSGVSREINPVRTAWGPGASSRKRIRAWIPPSLGSKNGTSHSTACSVRIWATRALSGRMCGA